MASARVEIDDLRALRAMLTAPGLEDAIANATAKVAEKANRLGSGFETERTRDWRTGEQFGGRKPLYKHDVVRTRNRKAGVDAPVGIVVTGNYAAMKDNHEHNTLLKAKG